MCLVPDLGGQLKVSSDAPNQATGGDQATAGCHLGSGHLRPRNHHISVTMETDGAEPSLRAV